jgi:hypothetical protein
VYTRQCVAWFTSRVQVVSMVSYELLLYHVLQHLTSPIACGVDTVNLINVMSISDHGLKNL